MKKLCLFLLSCSVLIFSAEAFSQTSEEARKQLEQQETAVYQQKVADWKAKHKNAKVQPPRLGENVEVFPANYSYKLTPVDPGNDVTFDDRRYKRYPNAVKRLLDNVNVRDQSETQITYVYNDARVDELAFLAAEYCYNQKKSKALLQKITLYQNRSRLATFDCVSL